MSDEREPEAPQGLKSAHVYIMATVCLLVGVALGYLFRGSAATRPPQTAVSTRSANEAAPQIPGPDDMKRMADKQAAPLLAKLKDDPKNSALLNQIGTLYKLTRQFKEAIGYYQQAIDVDPKNVTARTDLASCLYYQGDADGALDQLQKSLTYQPSDANTLFNLGLIRLKAKNDPAGALAAWQQLLKQNPHLDARKKSDVERLIDQARRRSIAAAPAVANP